MKTAYVSQFVDQLKYAARRVSGMPAVGSIDLGGLRRLTPISRKWGFDRGLPVDRFYIERFLSQRKSAFRGACLEVGDARYLSQFNNESVASIDVLHYAQGFRETTIVADLVDAPHIEDNRFDCIVCTQTLQFVSDPEAAVATLTRILRPGGTLLLTVPCLSQLDKDSKISWEDRWRFTSVGLRELFRKCDEGVLETEAYGNILTCVAFLHGLSVSELERDEILHADPMFEMIVCAEYRKNLAGNAATPDSTSKCHE